MSSGDNLLAFHLAQGIGSAKDVVEDEGFSRVFACELLRTHQRPNTKSIPV